MANNNKEVAEDKFESIESALSKTERYIEDNQKSLTIIVGAIVLAVGIYFGFTRWYLKPLEDVAQKQMFVAEQYFEKDSFSLALNGAGSYPGFLKIIDEYGLTKSAKLAHYYAGICYKNLGKYKEAIDLLKQFDADDKMISNIALGAIGDCYSELNDANEAVKYYKRAANNVKNDFTSPIYLMRAGVLLEEKGNYKDAVAIYETIQKEYNKTFEGQQIEKYITRAKIKGNIK
jgi:tetratricopeptide (TPR) repeat protein